MAIHETLTRYLEFCEIEKNLSQGTIEMYDFYLRDFIDWASQDLKHELDISEINEELVRKYRINLNRRISMKSNSELKRSTQKNFLVALRAFLKYLIVKEKVNVMSPDLI